MDWFGHGVHDSLIVIRAMHFAATTTVTGALIFRTVVAEPALNPMAAATVVVRRHNFLIASTALAIAASSGLIWVLLQAVAMSGLSLGKAMTTDVLFTVVTETQFGLVSGIRLVLAIILAGCLTYDRLLSRWLGLAAALGLMASIAWTGHAGSGVGEIGILHLTADILHLVAAAAWFGGLVSLVLLLVVSRNNPDYAWASFVQDMTQRFSTLGVVVVVTILATGVINTWILVGSLRGLIVTEYGRLLMLKMALFAVMLIFAAANRFLIVPRLNGSAQIAPQLNVLRQLTRNSIVEIALALLIFSIVGMLGMLHPAIHFVN